MTSRMYRLVVRLALAILCGVGLAAMLALVFPTLRMSGGAMGVFFSGAQTVAWTTAVIVTVAAPLGIVLGLAAAVGGRSADATLGLTVEATSVLPSLLAVAIVQAIPGVADVAGFVGVIAVVKSLEVARLVRGQALRLTGGPLSEAASAAGATRAGFARRHVLPTVLGPVLVNLSFVPATVVAFESALAFVGFGVGTPAGSWGRVLADAVRDGSHGTGSIPLLATCATVGAAYVVADALSDRLRARPRHMRFAREA